MEREEKLRAAKEKVRLYVELNYQISIYRFLELGDLIESMIKLSSYQIKILNLILQLKKFQKKRQHEDSSPLAGVYGDITTNITDTNNDISDNQRKTNMQFTEISAGMILITI